MDAKQKRILEKVSDACFTQLDHANQDLFSLALPVQTIIIIYTTQGIIENGGFEYFFEQDFPDHPPYEFFSNAYRRIGATKAAEHFERAIDLLDISEPHLHLEKRLEFLTGNSEKMVLFQKYSDAITMDESIWEKLLEYINFFEPRWYENAR